MQGCSHPRTGPAQAVPTATGHAATHATSATLPSLAQLTPTEKVQAVVSRYRLLQSRQGVLPAWQKKKRVVCVSACHQGLMTCANDRNMSYLQCTCTSAQHKCNKQETLASICVFPTLSLHAVAGHSWHLAASNVQRASERVSE